MEENNLHEGSPPTLPIISIRLFAPNYMQALDLSQLDLFISETTVCVAIPSSLPTKPKHSVVVAFRLI